MKKFEANDKVLKIEENGKPAFMNVIPKDKQEYFSYPYREVKEHVGENENGEPIFLVKGYKDPNYYLMDNNQKTYNFTGELGKYEIRNFGIMGFSGGKSKNLRKSRRNFSKRKTCKGRKRRKSIKKNKRTLKEP